MNAADIGRRVRDLRLRIGATPTQLAEQAGVAVVTVRKLERGAHDDVTLTTLTGVAAALELPVAVLLGEQPPPLHWPVDRVFWRQLRREVEQIQGVAS